MQFTMSNKEVKKSGKWKLKHAKKCDSFSFSYIFTETGIGTAVTVKCNMCGRKKNVTDYASW